MSIRLRDTKVRSLEEGIGYASESIELCACSGAGGEAKAFLPVKILSAADGNPAVATLAELKVSSDTQANSRGVRRVMVKVELPYQSLPEANVRATGGIVDTRRSGQPVSAHIVISVPRTAAEDLTGSRGIDAQRAAIAQVRGVVSLLLAFASPEMAGAVKTAIYETDGEAVTFNRDSVPADGVPLASGTHTIYTTFGESVGSPAIIPDALNGQPGLSLADLATHPMNGSDPLWRGLLGQKPLTCQQEVTLPTADVVFG